MLCQKCQIREATVHITAIPSEHNAVEHADLVRGGKVSLCSICSVEYEKDINASEPSGEKMITEHLRVVSKTPERTVFCVIRTENSSSPEYWDLRIVQPSWEIDSEVTIILSQTQLELLKGN